MSGVYIVPIRNNIHPCSMLIADGVRFTKQRNENSFISYLINFFLPKGSEKQTFLASSWSNIFVKQRNNNILVSMCKKYNL